MAAKYYWPDGQAKEIRSLQGATKAKGPSRLFFHFRSGQIPDATLDATTDQRSSLSNPWGVLVPRTWAMQQAPPAYRVRSTLPKSWRADHTSVQTMIRQGRALVPEPTAFPPASVSSSRCRRLRGRGSAARRTSLRP